MQGKRSTIGSIPDSINFDYGSTSTNMGIDQQICWNNLRDPAESRISDCRAPPGGSESIVGTVNQEAHNLTRWNIGETSSRNLQNPINRDERMSQNGWSSPMAPSTLVSPSLEDQVYESTSVVLRNGFDLNLNGDQVATGTSIIQASPNGSITSMSHNPELFATSSGTGGFLVEEEDNRPNYSLDGRRLSCKRKNIEGSGGPSSSSGICFSREGSIWQTVPPQSNAGSSSSRVATQLGTSRGMITPDPVNPRLRLSIGGVFPDSVYAHNMAVGPEISRRNYRVRTNPIVDLSNPARETVREFSVNPSRSLIHPIQPENSVSPQGHSAVLRLPGSWRNGQSLRSSGASSSRTGDAPLHEDLNSRPMPRNISEHPMVRPVVEVMDNSAPNFTGWNTNGVGLGTSRHVASSSRAGHSFGSQSSSGPTWGSPHQPTPSQYSRRLSEIVRRSVGSSTGSESGLHHASTSAHRSAPSQGPGLPSTGGSQGQNPRSSRSSLSSLWTDRHVDGAIGFPYPLRALAAGGEGRNRLVSEHLRSVLDMMRRGEGLRIEDVMILDPSVFFRMADIQDEHRDMRLDIDNMSYEELLALEERIGSVCTGLTEDKISAHMKQRKYTSVSREDQAEVVPCCICQEVYKDGEDIGVLDCGHDFHSECVKQWLTQKNSCPICKTTGLAT